MKKATIFTGCATALITPLCNGNIDYDCFGRLIERQILSGTDALVICGTTGECSTLSDSERCSCIEYAVKKSAGRIPVIAGTGSNDTAYSMALTRCACEAGADALLVVTPYYNKASEEGLIRSFTAIADIATKPLILYNVPARTGCRISQRVYRELSSHENIAAVKEASGNVADAEKIIAELGDRLDVYSGCDELAVPIMALGGKGVISVASNIIPTKIHEMCARCLRGDFEGAAELQLGLLHLTDALFCDVNPIPVKTAMEMLGLCSAEMRLPMCETDKDKRKIISDALARLGLL